MASLNRPLTWRGLLLVLLALWLIAGVISLTFTYLGGSHGIVRPPVQTRVTR